MKKGLRRVRSHGFVLLLPSTDASYWTSKIPCDLMALDQFMMITNYMFALPRGNSQLAERISAALLRLQEDGVLQRLFHKWWNSEECVGFTDSGYHFHPETNGTRPTEAAFVNVRIPQSSTESPILPTVPTHGEEQFVSPVEDRPTEQPTHSRNIQNRHSSASGLSSSSATTATVLVSTLSSQVSPHTDSSASSTNRHRHSNSRHGNRGNNRRNHGSSSSSSGVTTATTPSSPWDGGVDRIPDYIEGVNPPSVVHAPEVDLNHTAHAPVRYTFRPVTYTVPTTLSTTRPHPDPHDNVSPKGRNRNRVEKSEEDVEEEAAVGSEAQGFSTRGSSGVTLAFFCWSLRWFCLCEWTNG